MNKGLIAVVVIVILAAGGFWYLNENKAVEVAPATTEAPAVEAPATPDAGSTTTTP